MKKDRTIDMTEGSPVKHILIFMLPLLVGNIFQLLYNMADSVVVGKFVGKDALAAVGACSSLSFLFFALGNGLATGTGVIVSQYFGAKDEKRIRRTIGNAYYVLCSVALVLTILSLILSPHVLKIMRTPEAIIRDSTLYMRIMALGLVGITMYNGVAAILRAFGDSRTPLYFLIFSSIVNVVMDIFLVVVLHMGVAGVGLATIFSQILSALLSLVYAWKKVPAFRTTAEELRPDFNIIRNMFRLGVPIALQFAMISVSSMALQSVVNSWGENAIASFTITNRIEMMVQQTFMALSTALTTYAGQNKGAGNIDRVKLGFHRSILLDVAISAFLLVIMYSLGRIFAGLFVNEQEIVDIAARALRMTSPFYFFLGMIYLPRAVMNGCGDAAFAMINGVTEVICRVSFSQLYLHIPAMGIWGIWITTISTWLVTCTVCIIRYKQGKWKQISLK